MRTVASFRQISLSVKDTTEVSTKENASSRNKWTFRITNIETNSEPELKKPFLAYSSNI